MKYDRLWERLIEYLDEWASPREVPGGIEVTFQQSSGTPRTVEIVVSPADWSSTASPASRSVSEPAKTDVVPRIEESRRGHGGECSVVAAQSWPCR